MEKVVTADLSYFGYRELKEAVELLNAYMDSEYEDVNFLGAGLTLNFNTHSGNVFLSDEDYNVAMMSNGKLEQWFWCPYCGHEGFLEDMPHEPEDGECTDYLKEIGILEQRR